MNINGLGVRIEKIDEHVVIDGNINITSYGVCDCKKTEYIGNKWVRSRIKPTPTNYKIQNICGFREIGYFNKRLFDENAEPYDGDLCVMGYINPDSHKLDDIIVQESYSSCKKWFKEVEIYKQVAEQVAEKYQNIMNDEINQRAEEIINRENKKP